MFVLLICDLALEFDCNRQASLVRGVRVAIYFNAFREYIKFIDMGRQSWH